MSVLQQKSKKILLVNFFITSAAVISTSTNCQALDSLELEKQLAANSFDSNNSESDGFIKSFNDQNFTPDISVFVANKFPSQTDYERFYILKNKLYSECGTLVSPSSDTANKVSSQNLPLPAIKELEGHEVLPVSANFKIKQRLVINLTSKQLQEVSDILNKFSDKAVFTKTDNKIDHAREEVSISVHHTEGDKKAIKDFDTVTNTVTNKDIIKEPKSSSLSEILLALAPPENPLKFSAGFFQLQIFGTNQNDTNKIAHNGEDALFPNSKLLIATNLEELKRENFSKNKIGKDLAKLYSVLKKIPGKLCGFSNFGDLS